MPIVYSGGTIVDVNDFDMTSLATACADFETNLVAAGWSVISGSGTSDLMLQTATTPGGQAHRLRVWANSGFFDIGMRLYSPAGVALGSSAALSMPKNTSDPYRLVAHKYGFHLLLPGSTAAGTYATCETLYLPSFELTPTVPDQVCFLGINCGYHFGGGGGGSWRCNVPTQGALYWHNHQDQQIACYGTYSWSASEGVTGNSVQLVRPAPGQGGSHNFGRWGDNTALISEPLVAWPTNDIASTEVIIRGQLWNSFVATVPMDGDEEFSMDGHTWLSITNNNTGISGTGQVYQGTLCVAID